MRIPLDYYRILGLPIQATAEQLSQAYRDRALQLPRREYSEIAIASRKELLDEAYAVLSDSEQRSTYDASFLSKTYDQESKEAIARSTTPEREPLSLRGVDLHNPSIDIKNEQFVGALLILQELGEYELVVKLGQPYLTSGDSVTLDKGRLGDPQLVRPDIVLTLALACLELGREQWQQGQYENAATSLETGQELLLHEGLFPTVRGEIQADLYKLRPYRILELLALPDENIMERRKGLQLLQDMLQERMGIDGTGDDQSGLSIDDFLRFIQQLRAYLTAAQQQTLFETEARRPSAVATYLAVYALLARGFAERQPALISRAKQMLLRLGKRQDVHLEQSVCALLLGQTEEASRALELSQEYEPLAFIREHSQGSPDLLPGLCLYGERWLQNSVFPHFRDLANQKASLKDYFADEQVQAYLENLPEPSTEANNEWTVESQRNYAAAARGARNANRGSSQWSGVSNSPTYKRQPAVVGSRGTLEREAAVSGSSRTATLGTANGVSTLPTTQRLSQPQSLVSEPIPQTGEPGDSASQSGRGHPSRGASGSATSGSHPANSVPSSMGLVGLEGEPPGRLQRLPDRPKSSKKAQTRILLAIAALLGLGLLGWLLLSWLHKTLQRFSAPALEEPQAMVQLAAPPITIPEPGSQLIAPTGPLTEETAQQVIQSWLDIKKLALGSNHQINELGKILVNPSLSIRRQEAEAAKQNNAYWQYEHTVRVTSVQTNAANPDQARVEAAVKEVARFYQGGQPDQGESYDETLQVRYDLVRQRGQWFIKNMAVR
ncbi:MAG TPA: molecular chaperone DnaJ [Cyanobacteria bacterium UBA11370]|nr:molecular chaperone DnaJ [Cyanobacteria bacterium UBA11370]HBY80401.1 molecular chaperone DnaJ [Cyanobacteria bacterium UBA11148]